jgi:gallate dioxygenase
MMRGALSKKVKKLHQTYYLPSMTPIVSVIFENDSDDPQAETHEQFRTRMNHQTSGAEKLEGTYPFTIERSVSAFRINNFLHELIKPDFRKQFLADPEPLYQQYELTAEERDLITRRDWRGLIRYGVIFFLLEKLGAVVGTTNLHIYAAMRGQSLEDFQKTRNAQVLYSVAGQDEGKKNWDKPVARA